MTTTLVENNLPIVVFIGRANVGKSTLFNTLIEEKKALTSTIAGTTRTNNEGIAMWRGRQFLLIDTGGVDSKENELFAQDILKQSTKALDRADIIILVADAQTGVMPQEIELGRKIQKKYSPVPLFVVANKSDSKKIEQSLDDTDWYTLGHGKLHAISAVNGRGVGDLLDIIYDTFKDIQKTPELIPQEEVKEIRVALIGKPNVGKSSLFNKLIGQDKVIVSDIPHTTRESFDTQISYTHDDGTEHLITFIDTAGVRRKANVSGLLERAGIGHTMKSLSSVDIILLTLDGAEALSSQDMQLGGLIEKRSKSVVILINKWDLAEDNTDSNRNEVKRMVYAHFPHLDFAPLLFVSGKTGYKVNQIFPLMTQIAQSRMTQISQHELDTFIQQAVWHHKPARGKGVRQPEILGFKQINVDPPIFQITVKQKTSLHRSYLSYLENRLREEYNFIGTPIVIKITKMKK